MFPSRPKNCRRYVHSDQTVHSDRQQAVDAHTGRKTARRVTTREVKGIDQDVKLNRALWMLAERMAELKAA